MQVKNPGLKIIGLLCIGLLLFSACNKEDERKEEERIKLQQYLEANGYSSVEPTENGLYHVVIEEGTGPSPVRYDFINIEFTASLIDGTVFETSNEGLARQENIYRSDKLYGPAKFKLESLGIQGLREGILMMKEKGKSRIIIPSNLGFGASDMVIIPPYSTLIYDVELLDVISDPIEHEQELLDKYLTENEISVDPTESGLYYIEVEEGTGDLPDNSAGVTLHYKGYLLDGRLFDESKSGSPLIISRFAPDVIPGFIEGVWKMKKGGKARLIIPYELAFGTEGSLDGVIPPYTTVVYDVEVISIQ